MTVMLMMDAGDRGVHKISRLMIGGRIAKFRTSRKDSDVTFVREMEMLPAIFKT